MPNQTPTEALALVFVGDLNAEEWEAQREKN